MAEVEDACALTVQNIRKTLSVISDNNPLEWENVLTELNKATDLLKNETNRKHVPDYLFEDVGKLLQIGLGELKSSITECDKIYLPLTECFRVLRNGCVDSPRNQQRIYNEVNILPTTQTLCQMCLANTIPQNVLLLRCALQFLGNLAVGNTSCQKHIWMHFLGIFRDLVKYSDEKIPHYTCMVLHTCLSGLMKTEEGQAIVSHTIRSQNGQTLILNVLNTFEDSSEWTLYLLEDFLRLENMWQICRPILSKKQKILLLEVSRNLVRDSSGSHDDSSQSLAPSNLDSIAEDFIQSAATILHIDHVNSKDSCSENEHEETVGLILIELEVLCEATSSPDRYPKLRTNQTLLKTTINLLHGVTSIGKEGENVFSAIRKASSESSDAHHHPVFGLKRDLVRLIGNLAYRNTTNQDLVRDMDGLSLILDHTAIDERNPFVTQWSVFAIRNLCEDNQANKAIIAQMKMEGLANNVSMLRDFGIQAEMKDNKIVVKPVDDP